MLPSTAVRLTSAHRIFPMVTDAMLDAIERANRLDAAMRAGRLDSEYLATVGAQQLTDAAHDTYALAGELDLSPDELAEIIEEVRAHG